MPADMIKLRNKYRDNNHVDKLAYAIYTDVNYCIRLLSNNVEKCTVYHEKIAQLRTEIEADLTDQLVLSKKDIMKAVIGVSRPDNIDVEVPSGINNKGCRKRKRKVGAREVAAAKSKKKKRMCKKCNKYVRHDSRNHDSEMAKKLARKAEKAAKKAAADAVEEAAEAEEEEETEEEYSGDADFTTDDESTEEEDL